MNSEEYRRKLEEFGERVRQLNKDINLYEGKSMVIKNLGNLSILDKVFENRQLAQARYPLKQIQPTLLDDDGGGRKDNNQQ